LAQLWEDRGVQSIDFWDPKIAVEGSTAATNGRRKKAINVDASSVAFGWRVVLVFENLVVLDLIFIMDGRLCWKFTGDPCRKLMRIENR